MLPIPATMNTRGIDASFGITKSPIGDEISTESLGLRLSNIVLKLLPRLENLVVIDSSGSLGELESVNQR